MGNTHKHNDDCYKFADALLSENSAKRASDEAIVHVVTCSECQSILSSVADLRSRKSAFEGESYPELKQKIMQKLALKASTDSECQKVIKLEKPAKNKFAQWFKYAFAFAVVLCFFVYIISTGKLNSPVKTVKETIQTAQRIVSETPEYQITINGEIINNSNDEKIEISIFKNETAEVIYKDGTACHLVGPANIQLSKNEFSLTNGELTVDLLKENASKLFTGHTPHGEIKASKALFRVSVSPSITQVCSISGSLSITNLQGKNKNIDEGKAAAMLPQRRY